MINWLASEHQGSALSLPLQHWDCRYMSALSYVEAGNKQSLKLVQGSMLLTIPSPQPQGLCSVCLSVCCVSVSVSVYVCLCASVLRAWEWGDHLWASVFLLPLCRWNSDYKAYDNDKHLELLSHLSASPKNIVYGKQMQTWNRISQWDKILQYVYKGKMSISDQQSMTHYRTHWPFDIGTLSCSNRVTVFPEITWVSIDV